MPPKHAAENAPTEQIFAADDPRFGTVEEPNFDHLPSQLVHEHIWTNAQYKHVVVPFEDLPLPSSDRTRISPCTARFQFTGPFKHSERDKARSSLLSQLKAIFVRFGERTQPLRFCISFPSGVGRGKFVDITTGPLDLDMVTKVQLSFNKSRLEFIVVGPKIPHHTLVLEIADVPANLSGRSAAQAVAFQLQAREVGQILDMWKVTPSVAPEVAEVAAPSNYTLVAVLLPPTFPSGEIASNAIINIPGYIKLNAEHCFVKFRGRPDWCACCKSDAAHFHVFGQCQKLECFHCKERGHTADQCPKKMQEDHAQEAPIERPLKRTTLAPWNCATLQPLDCQHFLHDRSTFVGKADIVLLQEIRTIYNLNNNTNNTLLRPHAAFDPLPHTALLTYDTGILIRHTDWVVEEVEHTDRSTYARIRIPESSPAIGDHFRLLHVWSIHVPPRHDDQGPFWHNDVAKLSRLMHIPFDHTTAAIVGGDWNSVSCLQTDAYPANTLTARLLSAPFDLGQLCDAYRILHPGHPLFTRHHIVCGELLSSRRLDSIWISRNLLSTLTSASATRSPLDHAAVSVVLRTSAAANTRGPGTWRIHRNAHLSPGFTDRLRQYIVEQCAAMSIRDPPIDAWQGLKTRARAKTFDLSVEFSGRLHGQQQHRFEVLSHIEKIDIRQGDAERTALVAALRQLQRTEADLALAAADLFVARHDENMFRPTSWIIPKLESRSFAPMPDIREGRVTHTRVADKVEAVERFYCKLFTPQPWDAASESAAQTLLRRRGQRISGRTREQLERPFSVAELQATFRHRQDLSVPGLDGLTYPVLRILGEPYLNKLCRAANSLMAGQSLPEGQPMLRGVLLPKKGDPTCLSNYRPLSIADADFRLLGAAVSNRLQAAAQEVIPSTQTGFILHRQSAFNVVALYLIQHAVHAGKINKPIWILNLDQQKAYNRVRREWLDLVLQHYGFGERF